MCLVASKTRLLRPSNILQMDIQPPSFDGVWIGCDGAFDLKSGSAAIGTIYYLLGGYGSIFSGSGRKVFVSSALMAEALAAREACYLAIAYANQSQFIFSASGVVQFI